MAIENDKGVVPDFTSAAKYFRQAADLGDSDAAYALGLLYRNGTGVDKSDETGGAMDRPRGEGRQCSGAKSNTRSCCSTGSAFPKDETAAAKMFLKAAAHDNPVAQNRVARILAVGRGLPKEPRPGDEMAHSRPRRRGQGQPGSTANSPS